MAIFSSKESFRTLHESLAILKQMLVSQGDAIADEAKNLQSQMTVINGNVLDGQTDMKVFLTEQEEKHDKQMTTLTVCADEIRALLRMLNQTIAQQKVDTQEILRVLNETLAKQGTDIAELQRKVVILQARKA